MVRPGRWVRALRAGAWLVVGALALSAQGAGAAHRVWTNAEVLAALQTGKPFAERRAEIRNLDLSGVGVTVPFECSGCTFRGGIDAKDAVFARRVDLSGSTVKGPMEMQGSTFKGPAIFGTPSASATFEDSVDFTLAAFEGLASFDTAEFAKQANFTLARFEGDAIFAGTADAGTFEGPAIFTRASFVGAADFSYRDFGDGAEFQRVDFKGRADFSQSAFNRPRCQATECVSFEGSHFGGEATFLGTTLCGTTSFDHVRAAATLDFTGTIYFPEPPGCTFPPSFTGGTFGLSNVTAGAVVLSHALVGRGGLDLDAVATPDFFLDLGAIAHVNRDEREATLQLIESSAKARNDIALANDAHYRLQVLKSHGYSWPVRAADFVFYRGAAGYLLRPFHPLLTLFALAFLVSLLRARRPAAEAGTEANATGRPAGRRRRGVLGRFDTSRLRPGFVRLGHQLLDTLTLIWPGTAAKQVGRRFEALVYRVLFVCMLFGFANSNPTLRQMLDALI